MRLKLHTTKQNNASETAPSLAYRPVLDGRHPVADFKHVWHDVMAGARVPHRIEGHLARFVLEIICLV